MRLLHVRLVVLLCLLWLAGSAQTADSNRVKIAVFAPVYLDSAFDSYEYKLGSNSLPRYIIPGLDFYNGVMMAADSLGAEHLPVDILFYDSKTQQGTIDWLRTDPEFEGVKMIIAAFNNRSEVKPLADYALEHKIPLISETYPNDGGVSANPYFVMVNPRITTHIEAIYHYLHKNYPTDNITLFRKKGSLEDLILYMLMDMNQKTAGTRLRIRPVMLSDSASVGDITKHLDSTRQNIIVCGTLNETFGMNLTRGLADAKNYPSTVIGMPTWDGVPGIGKGIDMIYSTPYNLTRTDKLSRSLESKYVVMYASRPSDMFLKGFESVYHFTHLLLKNPGTLVGHLSDSEPKLFNEFDIRPVYLKKEQTAPDYLENRKLYFIRRNDGKLKSVN